MQAQYNPWIVALSYVVAVMASYLALQMASSVSTNRGVPATRWVMPLAAFAMGAGIWSMHFVGMLAFSLPIPVAYSASITFLSLVFAVAASYLALRIIRGEKLGPGKLAVGGLFMGGGVALMHYTGMAALEVAPRQSYDPALLTLSIVIAVAASTAALWLCFQLKAVTGFAAGWKKSASAMVMGLAIAGMHYTGMAATNFSASTYCRGNPSIINNDWLAVAVSLSIVLMLITAPLVSVVNARLERRDNIPIRYWSIVSYLVNGILLAVLALFAIILLLAVDAPARAAQQRHASVQVSGELMKASDDLTRAVRQYVVSGDPKFEQMYWQILAVRNGEAPRLPDEQANFWVRAAESEGLRPESGGEAVSLGSLMRRINVAPDELAAFERSESAFDAQLEIELTALNAMKGLFRDAAGKFTVHNKPDYGLARQVLFDDRYVQAKARVMTLVAGFQKLVESRTGRLSDVAIRHFERYLAGIMIVVMALFLSGGATYLVTRRKVANLLLLDKMTQGYGEPGHVFALDTTGRDEIGQLSRSFAQMHQKVTERTLALEREILERQRAEDESQRFFNQSQNLLFVAGFDGQFKRLNPVWESTLGHALPHLLAHPFMDMVHPEDRQSATEAIRQLAQGALAVQAEVRLLCADRTYKTFAWSATPQVGGEGFYATGHDITERKNIERALRTSEAQLHTIVENLSEGVVVSALDGRLMHFNQAAVAMHGFQGVGEGLRPFPELVDTFELSAMDGTPWTVDQWPLARLLRGEVVHELEARVRRIDDKDWVRIFSYSGVRVLGADGQPILVVLTLDDVTERKRTEIERQQAQKLESVGRLAAGIAHEINTPVQFINDCCHFVRDGLADLGGLFDDYRKSIEAIAQGTVTPQAALQELQHKEEAADLGYLLQNMPGAMERSLEGLQRVTTIVRSMKEFSHPDQKEMAYADLNQAIASTLTVARNEYKYVADVETDFGELPQVPCHLGDLNQAVLNLVVNSAHAIEDVVRGTERRGLIKVRTWCENNQAVVSIEDTGGGVPEHIRGKIFDPFFTTKAVGKGTGQGLAIARSVVVDKHHGRLELESCVGKGTIFTIRLPIQAEARRVEQAA